jgi:hypothetical protein
VIDEVRISNVAPVGGLHSRRIQQRIFTQYVLFAGAAMSRNMFRELARYLVRAAAKHCSGVSGFEGDLLTMGADSLEASLCFHEGQGFQFSFTGASVSDIYYSCSLRGGDGTDAALLSTMSSIQKNQSRTRFHIHAAHPITLIQASGQCKI